jgi:hypothetical protein
MAVEDGYEILDTTAAQLHDDVWGLALALNTTMTMINTNNITGTGCENLVGDVVPLEQFAYSNAKMGCLITWNLRHIEFSGVSVCAMVVTHDTHDLLWIMIHYLLYVTGMGD